MIKNNKVHGNKGKKRSEEVKLKASILAKERGFGKWNIGRKFSEEFKNKLIGNKNALGNKSRIGRKHTLETIEKIKKAKKENPFIYTAEIKRKISETGKGRVPWNKGLKGKQVGWNKGLKIAFKKRRQRTEAEKQRMSEISKARISKGIGLPPIHKGSDNSFWKGGISFEPYTKDFNNIFKNKIRLRDGLMCQKCNMLSEHNRIIFHHELDVHHINYDKKMSIPENCITLCRRCHAETNNNRDAWKIFYQKILSEKYDYKYTENGEIILEMQ